MDRCQKFVERNEKHHQIKVFGRKLMSPNVKRKKTIDRVHNFVLRRSVCIFNYLQVPRKF